MRTKMSKYAGLICTGKINQNNEKLNLKQVKELLRGSNERPFVMKNQLKVKVKTCDLT